LMIAEERHGALERQALSSNVTEFAESLEDQLTRAMAEIVERGRQVERLSSEAEAAGRRECVCSEQAARAVAVCEAKAAATRRHVLELRAKLQDRDARIGNLEDTVDALSGRVEAEVSRGEKLSAQNTSLKDMLDKQAKAMAMASEDEARAAVVAANTRCYALETKLGALAMDHRAAQRKMAKDLDTKVRAMDKLRAGVEAELRGLHAANARLKRALQLACDAALAAGVSQIPIECEAELGTDDGRGGAEALGETQQRVGLSRKEKSRGSRSPSPFRRFVGKRAASPQRVEDAEPAAGGIGGGASFRRLPVGLEPSARGLNGRPATPTNEDGRVADLLAEKRSSAKDAAALKHAARLRAVRGASRGKWGFSV